MWLIGLTVALAGTVRIHSAGPISVKLDGQYVGRLKNDITVADVPPGAHRLEVLDPIGTVLASSDIVVSDDGEPMWFDYYANRLLPVERELVPGNAEPISEVGLRWLSIKLAKKPNDEKRQKWFLKHVDDHWYEMRQVDSLLTAFETIAGRLWACSVLARRTVDPEKTKAIESQFPSGEHRAEAIAAFAAFWTEEEDE